VVFDLLRDADGADLLDAPHGQRRNRLAALLVDAPTQLTLCPQTTDLDQATEWLFGWTAAGVEGVVAKRGDGRYQPGPRGWVKCRARSTTEATIGGVTGSLIDPDTLLLGRYDPTGRLRYTGRSQPLSAQQRRVLIPLLTPGSPGVDHSWPQPLPAAWMGQSDQPEPVAYTPVNPDVVAEIDVDTAYEHHRWRHLVHYLRADSSDHRNTATLMVGDRSGQRMAMRASSGTGVPVASDQARIVAVRARALP
jgi:ATP-dependent DNA ligase